MRRAARWARAAIGLVTGRGGVRRLLLRRWFYALASRQTPVIAARTEAGTFLVDTSDRIIGRALFVRGEFELRKIRAMGAALRDPRFDAGGIAGKVVVEAGANIGTVTVPLVRELGAAQVIAFEPVPHNYRLLLQNLIQNEISDRVSAHQLAASDADGELTMRLAEDNTGDHRVVGPERRSDGSMIAVQARTIDGLLAERRIGAESVALLWADTQGHEARVLRGAAGLAEAGRPAVIEYWPLGLREQGELEALHELVRERFRSFAVEEELERGPVPIARFDELAERYSPYAFTDVLLLP